MSNEVNTKALSTSFKEIQPGKDNGTFAGKIIGLKENTVNVLNGFHKDRPPLEVLPLYQRQLIEEQYEKDKFPKAFSLAYTLGAVSAAVGNNVRAVVKKDWTEPALIFQAVVALPGQVKTPVQNQYMQPFKEMDRKYSADYSIEEKAYQTKRLEAAKDKTPFTEDPPVRKQTLIQDTTTEAMMKVLQKNTRGLIALSDELSALLGNINKYSKGDDKPLWLSIYNVQDYSKNRASSGGFYLCSPFVSIIGGIQPEILKRTFTDTTFTHNGMIDRFLYTYPEIIRKEVPGEDEIDPSLKERFKQMIRFLYNESDSQLQYLRRTTDTEAYINIPFTPEAKKAIYDYMVLNADDVNRYNETGNTALAGMYSKFDYHVIRLSLILQLMHSASNSELPTAITIESVRGGIALAEYFKHQAKRVNGLLTGDPLARYDENRRDLYNALADEFTTAQAVQSAMEIRAMDLEKGTIQPDGVDKWAKRFIKDRKLFKHGRQGEYAKINHKGLSFASFSSFSTPTAAV